MQDQHRLSCHPALQEGVVQEQPLRGRAYPWRGMRSFPRLRQLRRVRVHGNRVRGGVLRRLADLSGHFVRLPREHHIVRTSLLRPVHSVCGLHHRRVRPMLPVWILVLPRRTVLPQRVLLLEW